MVAILSDKEYEYFQVAVKTFVKEVSERFHIDVDTALRNIDRELRLLRKGYDEMIRKRGEKEEKK